MSRPSFHGLLDPLPMGACVVDADLTIKFWNGRMEEWTQLPREEVLERRLDEVCPAIKQAALRRIRSVLQGGPPAFFSAQLHGSVIPAALPNGQPRRANTTVSLLEGTDAALPEALLVAEDVTAMMQRLEEHEALRAAASRELEQRRKAEQRLQDMARELARSNRELDDFASIVAHDLQAPIRHVITWSQVLKEDYGEGLDAGSQQCLAHIQRSGEAMRQLVQDVLNYSRVTTRARPYSEEPLDAVLADVGRTLALTLQDTGGQIIAGDLPSLKADATQMRQLFTNLIGNALKFRKPDVSPVVRVCACRDAESGSGWIIEVQDNGIGFDPTNAGQIFKMCRRLHTASEYEGTGVGLAICRRIAERHGAEIEATAIPGDGATFRLRWPDNPAETVVMDEGYSNNLAALM